MSGLPLIVQNDLTVLADSSHPEFAAIHERLAQIAELLKSPEQGMHTYRITPLSLWNAAAEGMDAAEVVAFLDANDRYGLPSSVSEHIKMLMARYGSLRLEACDTGIRLVAEEWKVMRDICEISMVRAYFRERTDACEVTIDPLHRGDVKRELLRAGYPVIDTVGYHQGEALPIELIENEHFQLRDYQQSAIRRFYKDGSASGGSGVIVLPCGAGKTMVGIGLMAQLKCATLILTSNTTSVHQWKNELLSRTNAEEEWVGEYTGAAKKVRPITIATYQIMTYRKNKEETLAHIDLFHERDWGLIIYDEVHLLPAPVFRMTAEIQATRRLGLTATLVREDGREEDVFSLIGPKRYEHRWKSLESSGYIASARCQELSVPFTPAEKQRYLAAPKKSKHRIAGENPRKLQIVKQLINQHHGSKIMIIGQYLEQLKLVGTELGAPIITGRTSQKERDRLYASFKTGDLNLLIVSKVANFAVDLPEASVAIQISGSFGSRQEEAQRLGRILRPKKEQNKAYFYSIITEDSCEAEFARNRQLFLVEQGYEYETERERAATHA